MHFDRFKRREFITLLGGPPLSHEAPPTRLALTMAVTPVVKNGVEPFVVAVSGVRADGAPLVGTIVLAATKSAR
jgi:hypothetical protein